MLINAGFLLTYSSYSISHRLRDIPLKAANYKIRLRSSRGSRGSSRGRGISRGRGSSTRSCLSTAILYDRLQCYTVSLVSHSVFARVLLCLHGGIHGVSVCHNVELILCLIGIPVYAGTARTASQEYFGQEKYRRLLYRIVIWFQRGLATVLKYIISFLYNLFWTK